MQHAPFEYSLTVTNDLDVVKQGTCRIFLIPKVDERGQALRLRDQRALAVEMDKFLVTRKWAGARRG